MIFILFILSLNFYIVYLCDINVQPKTFIVDSNYLNKRIEFKAKIPSQMSEFINEDTILWEYPVGDGGIRRKVVPLYIPNRDEPVYYELSNSTIILNINLVNETYINDYTLRIFGSSCTGSISIRGKLQRNGKLSFKSKKTKKRKH